jgi:hypothetical protein
MNKTPDDRRGAVAGPVDWPVRPRLTPWFWWTEKPARAGMYRVQDRTMNCGCCWFDAHWNGREWHTDLFTRGVFNTLLFDSQVKRWRGLARRPNTRFRRPEGPACNR